MDFSHFTAGKDDSGRRIDRVLRRFLSEENLSSIFKSLRKGFIKVDGKKVEGSFRVNEGSDIQIASFLLNNHQVSLNKETKISQDFSLTDFTVFKNESILILNKPYDIPVQPSPSSQGSSLSELVQAEYEKNHKDLSLSFKTGPLHRLDRKTTGLIAFSQNLKGAQWFSREIQKHTIQKVYLALLEGYLNESQIWEDKIEKSADTNSKSAGFYTVSINSESGKNAYTEVTPLTHGIFNEINVTLAKVLIKTGRTHQIRSQSASHGFPLLGDTAYGGSKINSKIYGEDFFLHAYELHFPKENPLNLPDVLSAPLPIAFNKILELSGIKI